jgi:hypothetical protein
MSSKAEYEERKRLRNERKDGRESIRDNTDMDITDILDRMATAFERIADALEPQNMSSSNAMDGHKEN